MSMSVLLTQLNFLRLDTTELHVNLTSSKHLFLVSSNRVVVTVISLIK
jgi:hypothetical protein